MCPDVWAWGRRRVALTSRSPFDLCFQKLLLTHEIRYNKFKFQAYTRALVTSMANHKSSDVLIQVDKLQQQQTVSIHLFSCSTGDTKKGKSTLVNLEPVHIMTKESRTRCRIRRSKGRSRRLEKSIFLFTFLLTTFDTKWGILGVRLPMVSLYVLTCEATRVDIFALCLCFLCVCFFLARPSLYREYAHYNRRKLCA